VKRIPTHIVQKLSDNSGKDIALYLANLQKIKMDIASANLQNTKMERDSGKEDTIILFGNYDETPIQFDMATGHTYDFKGVKEVCIQTTLGVKMRMTVLLAILSNGIMLPPLFIFNTKKKLPEELIKKYGKDCLLFANQNGWITEDILLEWFDKIWLNLNISENTKPVLIFDKCRVHISAKVLEYLEKKEILYQVIPAGTTGYLQPLDVSINRPIKVAIKVKFDNWYQSYGISEDNKTNAGYLRPPSYDMLIKWTLEASREINSDVIIHSFKTTGNYFSISFYNI